MPLPKRPTVAKAGKRKEKPKTGDSRFANFQSDPRFRLPAKKEVKKELDPRFARLETDPDFKNQATLDKYGRRISKEVKKEDSESESESDEDEDEDDDVLKIQSRGGKKADKAVRKELAETDKQRGKAHDPIRDGGFSSSSDSESDEDEHVEDEAELAEQDVQVPMGEVSTRLAAVNMDWDNIRASDILAVANSFVPAGGKILNVTIYPSEFGMERLQREELEGPPREIFASSTAKNEDNISSLIEAPESSDSEQDNEPTTKKPLKESNGEEFDSTALRAYQLDRLRYYYAIITTSAENVAKSLYDNMDGMEYLSSANFFDLRFVPDEVTFDEDPHDQCEKLPNSYKPNEFTTGALTHSKVNLTWDADDRTRQEAQKRAFSRKEIDENELQAYLGTDSSSSEEEDDGGKAAKAAALRASLGLDATSKSSSQPKPSKRERDFKKPEGEMQVTFSAALSTNPEKGSVFENEPPADETTLEKYVRKQKERKERRKAKYEAVKEGRDPDAEEVEDQSKVSAKVNVDEDDPWNDPFFEADPAVAKAAMNQTKKMQRAEKREEREKQEAAAAAERANLELLMLDDEGSRVQHFNMNEIAKAEKAKKKGKKKSKAVAVAETAVEDDFKINVQDPRFAKIYESHEFAIDPTNPKFKPTQGMKALLDEGRKKRKHDRDGEGTDREQKKSKNKVDQGNDVDDVKKLAARVKAKSKV
ncbi:hypothetical protein K504DRAFT_507791 [Pleomassaria siparia CBS 279.74]|uniref:Uncharacterized protein n=1 Tax=Pleomassaria siparia CBS 279.74 TaxID=1314801 RepID=A0A6G1JSH6_9PLEO|nr:hypothetical protein K504DRAFT_507791 [Pleomassaria siparia CBS 279.74]